MTVVSLPERFTIGGSEAAAVLGLDRYCSPTLLAARKLGQAPPQEETEAMRNGRRAEKWNRAWLEEDGYELLPPPAEGFVHPELRWWTGHPDALTSLLPPVGEPAVTGAASRGLVLTNPPGEPVREVGVRAPVELKAHGVEPSEELWLRDTIQAHHYLGCTGDAYALLSVIAGGYGGFSREERIIERDDGLLALMAERYVAFLALLQKGELPEFDGSQSTRGFARSRPLEQRTMRLSRAGWGHVRQAKFHHSLEKQHAEQREWHEQQVQAEMGEATTAISPFDDEVAHWTEYERKSLDSKLLRAEHPRIAATYTKTTTARRFTIT